MYEHLTFYTYEGLLIVVGPANAVDAAMPMLPACRATLLRFAHPLPSARSLIEAVRPHLRRAAREHGVAASWVVPMSWVVR